MSRIIAGRAKGHRLSTPKGDRTRPTTDRVREALFSSLASWFGTSDLASDEQLDSLAVLDLFGGSGAIGLEAASRGASRTIIVEGDPSAAALIRRNARETGLDVQVIAARLPTVLSQLSGSWDLVFADPPYDMKPELIDQMLLAVGKAGFLAPDSLVVVERSARSAAPNWPEIFVDSWQRSYGETVLHFATNQPDNREGTT